MSSRPRSPRARSATPVAALAAAVLAVGALAGGCAERRDPGGVPGSGVLLIAIDGLRADHVSGLGYDRPTTPNLDRLAEEGVSFPQTMAAAPWLLPSNISLLTGCDPNVSRWNLQVVEEAVEHRWRVPDGTPSLAVSFLVAGYATAAFVDHEWLAPVYGLAPGFQQYEKHDPSARPGAALRDGFLAKSASLVQWLRSLNADRSWFAYLHVHDLERVWAFPDPVWDDYFEPRPELSAVPPVSNADRAFFAVPRSRWPGGSVSLGRYEARYDGALRRLDGELQGLFETLQVMDRWDRTTVCIVGTHGVQFGEAAMILDHGLLSMADLHVPWILRVPDPEGAGLVPGLRPPHVASTMDVMPTLLDLEGLPIPELVQGVSQLGAACGDPEPAREYAFASCGLQQGNAVIGDRLVWEGTEPGNTAGVTLRTTWFGDDEPHTGEWRELVYDRLVTPFPFLDPDAALDPDLAEPLLVAFRNYWVETLQTRASARGEMD